MKSVGYYLFPHSCILGIKINFSQMRLSLARKYVIDSIFGYAVDVKLNH